MYDFGPVGGRLRSRLNQVWVDHWLSMGDVVEISCPTVTPYEVLALPMVSLFKSTLPSDNNDTATIVFIH